MYDATNKTKPLTYKGSFPPPFTKKKLPHNVSSPQIETKRNIEHQIIIGNAHTNQHMHKNVRITKNKGKTKPSTLKPAKRAHTQH